MTVEWIEGDAEQLPFAAGSFDRVLSAFGCSSPPATESWRASWCEC